MTFSIQSLSLILFRFFLGVVLALLAGVDGLGDVGAGIEVGVGADDEFIV